jgi:hypothetical protein
MGLDRTVHQFNLGRPNCLIFKYIWDTLADYCTKFKAISLHEVRETDGGTKNAKIVLGQVATVVGGTKR